RFHEQKLVEKFCRESQLLKIIEGNINEFLGVYKRSQKRELALAPLIIRLDFHFAQLRALAPQLLRLAIDEPLQFADAIKYSIYSLVRAQLKSAANDSGLKVIDITQVHTLWRFLDLPLHRQVLFDPNQHLYPFGLSLVHGILSAFTTPETNILQSVWYCGSGCIRNAIQNISTNAPPCSNCSRPMSEYAKLRITEPYRLIAVLPGACIQTPRTIDRIFRPIIVRIRAHTYDCKLKLGALYLATGYYCTTATTYIFEACHLKEA
ncbi:mei-217, partial [Drosophila busckii]